jgi:hypothetical protein
MFIDLFNPLCTYLPTYVITKITNDLTNVWTDMTVFLYVLIFLFFMHLPFYVGLFLCDIIQSLVLVKQKYVMKFKLHDNKNAPSEMV